MTEQGNEGGGAAREPAPLDCLAAVRRLWDYLDGELSAWDERAVDEHLAACAGCPPHFEFERTLLAAVAEARAEHPDPEALRARLRAVLAREGYTGR
jgi:anti-sigma factor (TIGR02949 family)